MDMNTLLHYGGMIVTFLFVAAVLYSMIMAIRRRSRKQKAKEAVEKRTHIKIKNLNSISNRTMGIISTLSVPSNIHGANPSSSRLSRSNWLPSSPTPSVS